MKLTYEDKLKIIEFYKQGFGSRTITIKFNLNDAVVEQIIYRFKFDVIEGLKYIENKIVFPSPCINLK